MNCATASATRLYARLGTLPIKVNTNRIAL
jgi:hypothetical protein